MLNKHQTLGASSTDGKPIADESQFSSKQLSSSIDGVGRCPLPLISKRVLFSSHVLIEQLLAVGLPSVELSPSNYNACLALALSGLQNFMLRLDVIE